MEKTSGFVLKVLKYGDTSAILKVYTKDFGMLSFIQKGFFNPKKKLLRVLQFPFALAEFSFQRNSKSDLIMPHSITPLHDYSAVYQNPIKLMVLQFLSECCLLCLQQEEENQTLFNFVTQQIQTFHQKNEQFADFHLIFLIELSRFLGFYPNANHIEYPYFDLLEGQYSNDPNTPFLINEEQSLGWKKLIGLGFTMQHQNKFNQKERNALNEIILQYYQLHIPNFKIPQSLEIIQEVMNGY